MTTRIDCSEAGFNEFLLANPQLDGHADLIDLPMSVSFPLGRLKLVQRLMG